MQNTSENAPQVIKTGTSTPLLNMEAPHKARTPSAIRQRVVQTFFVLHASDSIIEHVRSLFILFFYRRGKLL